MFNFPPTKSWQQRKTARHCKTPMNSKIVSIGSYVLLFLTRFPVNRDCLLKLKIIVKSARRVSCELHWEKRVFIGLTSCG